MRHGMVKTKDVRRADTAIKDLLTSESDIESMMCLWGKPGVGKTTTVTYLASRHDGIHIRALGCSTVTSVLGDLCIMLGGKRMLRRSDMVEYIVDRLTRGDDDQPLPPRPIFVDEADYLLRSLDMLDCLRDIYDNSGVPVVLIGMEDIARKIRENGRFARRITQWIEFQGLDLEDATLVAREACEVTVEPDLIEYVHGQCVGNIGRIKIGFDKIEKFARSNRLESIGLAQWGERDLYFDQPKFGTSGSPKLKAVVGRRK